MAHRYSVAEARTLLPSILVQAEAGEAVELTRRGRPVAVILSCEAFERLRSERPQFGPAYRAFLKKFPLEEVGLERDFAASRPRSLARSEGEAVTMRYLLDTSTLSEPMKKAPDAALVAKIEAHAHESAIAAPVWHELQYGFKLLPAGKRRNALEAYLKDVVYASFPILPYDEHAAAWHADERARLDAEGTPAPFVDGQIAAIAQINGLVLVTVNVRDFRHFNGLTIENWSTGKKK